MRLSPLVLVLLAGCSTHRTTFAPAPPFELPRSFAAGSSEGEDDASRPWWDELGDPTLSALETRALAGSFQLASVRARIAQVDALTAQARSGYWPQIDFSLTGGRRHQQPPNFGDGIELPTGPGGGAALELEPFDIDILQGSIAAGYEVDFWQRIDDRVDAANRDLAGARDELESAAMTVSASVAEAYYDLVAQRLLLDLVEAQIATQQTFLDLVQARFEQGLGSALEVLQQRAQLRQAASQRALVRAARRTAAHRLALLVGTTPDRLELAEAAGLPALPPVPDPGVPADLLVRRPDVRAAQRRVEAADYRISAAIGDRLPSLRLTGSVGLEPNEPKDFFGSPVWQVIAQVTAPLWDGGRRGAEVDRARAVKAELVSAYGLALLQAVTEVENALVLERRQTEYVADLEAALAASRDTLREAQARYQAGLADYLSVLTALSAVQRAEQGLLTAERQRLSYRIQLHRALGGAWVTAALDAEALAASNRPAPTGP